MKQPLVPDDVENSDLRRFGRQAEWVARLEAAVAALEDLCLDLIDDDPDGDDDNGRSGVLPDDPLEVGLEIVRERYESDDRELEGELIDWLAHDPENWSLFTLLVLNPWQSEPGQWKAGAPNWVLTLGSNAVIAHFQHDRYGRQRLIDLGTPDCDGK